MDSTIFVLFIHVVEMDWIHNANSIQTVYSQTLKVIVSRQITTAKSNSG